MSKMIPSKNQIDRVALLLVQTLKQEAYEGHPLYELLAVNTPENAVATDPIWRIAAMATLSVALEDSAPRTPPPAPTTSTDPQMGTSVRFWSSPTEWLHAVVTRVVPLGPTKHVYDLAVFTHRGIVVESAIPFSSSPAEGVITLPLFKRLTYETLLAW